MKVRLNLDKATEKFCLFLLLKFISCQKLVLCAGVSASLFCPSITATPQLTAVLLGCREQTGWTSVCSQGR